MKKYREIIETTIINEDNTTEKHRKEVLHTIKNWEELTTEEKEKEIENNSEYIYEYYQDYKYREFKDELDNIKCDYKNITFDDIYLDSNSQGFWIDSIKNFKYHVEGIEVFGEYVDLYDVDFHISNLIEDFTINIDDYSIEDQKLEKIKNTKKFKKWYEAIEKDLTSWIEKINQACEEIGQAEFYTPWNLNNEEDKHYLDNYFLDTEFEKTEILKEV